MCRWGGQTLDRWRTLTPPPPTPTLPPYIRLFQTLHFQAFLWTVGGLRVHPMLPGAQRVDVVAIFYSALSPPARRLQSSVLRARLRVSRFLRSDRKNIVSLSLQDPSLLQTLTINNVGVVTYPLSYEAMVSGLGQNGQATSKAAGAKTIIVPPPVCA